MFSFESIIPITQQPGFSDVRIRNLTETPEDTTFAGRLSVEAFKDKLIHATSEQSIPKLKESFAKAHIGQDPVFYQRYFIAEINNERAGIMTLKIQSDPREKDDGTLDGLGCCNICGLICMFMCILDTPSPGTCCVECVAVDERFRGRGIGKVLLDRADNEARLNGCKSIYLWVAANNRAKNLYERHGYQIKDSKTCCIKCVAGVPKILKMEKSLQ